MPSLSDPLLTAKLELKNRIVMPPMANDLATADGEVTGQLIDHYRRPAEADVALVIIEHSYITPGGKMSVNQLGIHQDSLVPGLQRLAAAIRDAGAKSAIQLTHAGANTSAEVCGCQPVGPSEIPASRRREKPRPLEVAEIKDIVAAYREAARRAREAGFDAVEIHGAHGFLLNEFTSPYTNKRSDSYGGSLANRLRLPLEVIGAIRAQVGKGFPLLYRFGANDFLRDGIDLDQARKIAPALVEAGIDILDISGGLCGSRPETFQDVQGYFVPLAQTIKAVVEVPVIAVGGIKDAKFANQVIVDQQADLVAVGRALLKNPLWAREALTQLKSV